MAVNGGTPEGAVTEQINLHHIKPELGGLVPGTIFQPVKNIRNKTIPVTGRGGP
jgi:hypothetical protein